MRAPVHEMNAASFAGAVVVLSVLFVLYQFALTKDESRASLAKRTRGRRASIDSIAATETPDGTPPNLHVPSDASFTSPTQPPAPDFQNDPIAIQFRMEASRLHEIHGEIITRAVSSNTLGKMILRDVLLSNSRNSIPPSSTLFSRQPTRRAVITDSFGRTEPTSGEVPVHIAITGGAVTAGECVTPAARWSNLVAERLDSLLRNAPPARPVHIVNTAQSSMNTMRAAQFAHALFAPKADMVFWEFTQADRSFLPDAGATEGRLRAAHDVFTRRMTSMNPDAVLVWVFLWDELPETSPSPIRSVEDVSHSVRASSNSWVPQIEMSLARLVFNGANGLLDSRSFVCNGQYLNAAGHAALADLVMYALADAVLAPIDPVEERSALVQWESNRNARASGYVSGEVGADALLLRRHTPEWSRTEPPRPLRARGFPFSTPQYFPGAYVPGEEFLCTHKRFAWDSIPVKEWIPLRLDNLAWYKCEEFDFFGIGYASANRSDTQAVVSVPDCSRGSFAVRFPYAVRDLPSFPCDHEHCKCSTEPRGSQGILEPWSRTLDDIAIPANVPVSTCCRYTPPERINLHDLFVVEDLSNESAPKPYTGPL